MIKKKIMISGGESRFCFYLKKNLKDKQVIYANKKTLNILNYKNLIKVLKKNKIKIFIHIAALSRPMKIHETNIDLSIQTNIIGTANVVRACKKLNIKLIYFSTNYVYPCNKGNYTETDKLLPINNYAWSKLGGECSVMLYKNSLIVRASMTEKPFVHKAAFSDFLTNFIFHEDIAPKVFKLLNLKGIINFGGKSQSVFKFAKKYNPKIKKISCKKIFGKSYPSNTSMNLNKFKKI